MLLPRKIEEFATLGALAKRDPNAVRESYGRIELHPGLPAGKNWLMKWEQDDPAFFAARLRPRTQGEALGVGLDEFAHLPIAGIRFLTLMNNGKSDAYVSKVQELNAVAAEAHQAGFLCLVGQTIDCEATEPDLIDRSVKGWHTAAKRRAASEVLFAAALREGQVDYDAYIVAFPGSLNWFDGQRLTEDRELAKCQADLTASTTGRLKVMASEGSTDTVPRRAEIANAKLQVVGTVSGPAVWGLSFWDVDWDELLWVTESPDAARLRALNQIRMDLCTGGAKTRHNDLRRAITSPYWDALGITEDQADAPSTGDARNPVAATDTPVPSRQPLNQLSKPSSGVDLWNSYDDARQQAIKEFFGPAGNVNIVCSDHDIDCFLKERLRPSAFDDGSALSLVECQLSVFNGMADYVDTFLFHPANMAGRYKIGQ